jgi:hypothetical protein
VTNIQGKAIILLLLLSSVAWAQVSIPNTMQAFYTEEAITIDGRLNEECWEKAVKISNFTQRELNIGQPASERTEVAIVYSPGHIYIGVWCYDSEPQKLISKELKRDFNFDLDDNFIIVLDTYNDERNGFMFVTNPRAARADLQIFNNGGSSNAFWNGVWDVRTQITSEGWFAEFEIPLYTLKYRMNIEEQVWGINFERNIRRKREQVLWQGWSRDNRIQQVNQAGTLTGLTRLGNRQFVEIKPYGIGGGEDVQGDYRYRANGGGDINYLITPTYRLNLTFNPDFAQVEADQQQINLTRFPLFFPELREFFLEGDDFFNMGFGGNRIIPFYTRRMGLDENLNAVPIVAGGRLLGKEQNRTIGLMSLQTANYQGRPSENYTIGSWRQDVGKQSIVGIMSANKIENNRVHSTTGANGRYSTSRFLKNKNLDVGGALIQTYNSDEGYNEKAIAYRAFVSYPNDIINIFASTQRGPQEFNPELGLMLRRNFRESFAYVGIRPRPKKNFTWIRQFDFSPGNVTLTQYDDTRNIQSFEYRMQYFGFDTRKGDRIVFEYVRVAEGLISDFQLNRDIVIPQGTYWWNQWEGEVRTFRGRTLSLTSRFAGGEFYDGNSFRNRTDVLWRASKHFNMSVRYEKNIVTLPGGSFETDLIGNRIEYAINPNAFGSLLTQWNNAQKELNINFRLHIIPKIGTDFFLIVNQLYDTRNNTLVSKRGTILGKLIWRFTV